MSSPSTDRNKEQSGPSSVLPSSRELYKSCLQKILSLKAVFPNGEYSKIFVYCENSLKVTCRLCSIEMECRDILNHITWTDHLAKVNEYKNTSANESTRKLVVYVNNLEFEGPLEREYLYSLTGFLINTIVRLKQSRKMEHVSPHYLNEYKKFIDRRNSSNKGMNTYKSLWFQLWPNWFKRALQVESEQYRHGLQKKIRMKSFPSLRGNTMRYFKEEALRITHPYLSKDEILAKVLKVHVSEIKQNRRETENTKGNEAASVGNKEEPSVNSATTNTALEQQSDLNKVKKSIPENKIKPAKSTTTSISTKQHKNNTESVSSDKNKLAADNKTQPPSPPPPPVLKSILKKRPEQANHNNSNESLKRKNEEAQVLLFADDDYDESYYRTGALNKVTAVNTQNKNNTELLNLTGEESLDNHHRVSHKKIKINLLMNKDKMDNKKVSVIDVESINCDDDLQITELKCDGATLKSKTTTTESKSPFVPYRTFFNRQTSYRDNKKCSLPQTTRSMPNCLIFADDEDL